MNDRVTAFHGLANRRAVKHVALDELHMGMLVEAAGDKALRRRVSRTTISLSPASLSTRCDPMKTGAPVRSRRRPVTLPVGVELLSVMGSQTLHHRPICQYENCRAGSRRASLAAHHRGRIWRGRAARARAERAGAVGEVQVPSPRRGSERGGGGRGGPKGGANPSRVPM